MRLAAASPLTSPPVSRLTVRSIRGRIAISLLLMLALLCLTAAVAALAGRSVAQSFARYESAQRAARHVTEAAELSALLQLDLARYAGSEIASDAAAAARALSALEGEVFSSIASLAPIALQETARLPDVMARVESLTVTRRDAAANIPDAATTLNTVLTAIFEGSARSGLSETGPVIVALQATANRYVLLALRFQLSVAPPDLEIASKELEKILGRLAELAPSFVAFPRLQRQLGMANVAAHELGQAVDDSVHDTLLRMAATARLDQMAARIKADLDAVKATSDIAGQTAQKNLTSTIQRSGLWLLAVVGLGVLLGVTCIVALDQSCVRPLNALVRSLRGVAAGRLQPEISYCGRIDEIGEIARAVLTLRDGAVRTLMLETEVIAFNRSLALQRQLLATEKANVTEEALGGVARTVGLTAERLLVAADRLGDIVGRTSIRAGNVVIGSEQSRASAEGVAIAAEHLVRSIAHMAREVKHAAVVTAGAGLGAGRTQRAVQSLSAAASGIEQATKLIAEVAERTKLLALNASIEAVRAGASGLGFKVVASEVKALALQTAAATVRIAAQVQEMKLATHEAVETIDATRAAFASVDQLASNVVAAVDEQHNTMRGIVAAASQSAMAANEVAAAMQAVVADASEAARSVDGLRSTAAHVAVQGTLLETELQKVIGELRTA